MSYIRKFRYEIIPAKSYPVLHNCSSCKNKSTFISTDHFRINANGNRIDIWLIYQCRKCGHTLNLTIYERCNAKDFSSEQMKGFMENDKLLARRYGTDKSLFTKNRTEIDWSCVESNIINMETGKIEAEEQFVFQAGDFILIENPYGLKIRTDKIIAAVIHTTRSMIKQKTSTGEIEIHKNSSNLVIEFYCI